MADYINRKDVMELLSRLKAAATRIDDPGINTVFAMRGFVDEAGAYEIVERLVEKLPSVDVASVVRCKDCKHSGLYQFGVSDNQVLACLEIEEDGFVRMASAVDPNDFCSHGERRGTDGSNG